MARCARLPLSGFAGLLHGKACHTILRSLRFLTNRVPLPPLFRGQNKTPRNTLFINGSTVSTSYCATELRGWQRRYKKWRRRRRTSPAGTVSQPIGKPFNGQAKGLLWLTWRSYAGPPQYYITPEGESPQPACKAKPITGRTLGAQGQRPGGAINPRPRKTTVGRLNGKPFYGQAKGQLRPTCTSYAGCAHQPSGILESTAQVPVPIPTAACYPRATTFPSPSNIFSVPVTRV